MDTCKYIIWVPGQNGVVNENAVVGGKEANGEKLYIGRFEIEENLVPGKIPTSHGVTYVPFGTREHNSSSYEYLVKPRKGKFEWEKAEDGKVPKGAVMGGYTKHNEKLYIARAEYKGSLVVGKVHGFENCAFISYDGKEIPVNKYEVLTYKYISWIKEAKRLRKNLPRIALRIARSICRF